MFSEGIIILLMKKASEMGDAWMMAEGFFHASRSDEEQFQLARASTEKGGCGWDLLSLVMFSRRNRL